MKTLNPFVFFSPMQAHKQGILTSVFSSLDPNDMEQYLKTTWGEDFPVTSLREGHAEFHLSETLVTVEDGKVSVNFSLSREQEEENKEIGKKVTDYLLGDNPAWCDFLECIHDKTIMTLGDSTWSVTVECAGKLATTGQTNTRAWGGQDLYYLNEFVRVIERSPNPDRIDVCVEGLTVALMSVHPEGTLEDGGIMVRVLQPHQTLDSQVRMWVKPTY